MSCSNREENLANTSTNVNSPGQCCKKKQKALIFTLSNDNLKRICKNLPAADQINFGLTCQRFFNVMQVISKTEYVYVNTDNFYHWSPEIMKNFLRVVGAQIKYLEIHFLPKQPIFNDLGSFCINVEKLKVGSTILDTNSMISVIENMKLLEDLEIICAKVDDKFCGYLKKFKFLKNLSITYVHNITGNYLHLLSDLQKLTLHQCLSIISENFKNICFKHRNLHYLDIMYCRCLEPGDCEIISTNLLQLETLKLACSHDDIKCLAQLPKLKKLEIQVRADKAKFFFQDLAQFRGNDLEELYLHSAKLNTETIFAVSELKNLKILHIVCREVYDDFLWLLAKLTELEELELAMCYLITDRAILKILENCLKLKRLDLERCDGLTPTLLEDGVKLLKTQHTEGIRKDRMIITGICTYNTAFVKNLHLANNFSDLVEVSLEVDDTAWCDYRDSDSDYEDDFI